MRHKLLPRSAPAPPRDHAEALWTCPCPFSASCSRGTRCPSFAIAPHAAPPIHPLQQRQPARHRGAAGPGGGEPRLSHLPRHRSGQDLPVARGVGAHPLRRGAHRIDEPYRAPSSSALPRRCGRARRLRDPPSSRRAGRRARRRRGLPHGDRRSCRRCTACSPLRFGEGKLRTADAFTSVAEGLGRSAASLHL